MTRAAWHNEFSLHDGRAGEKPDPPPLSFRSCCCADGPCYGETGVTGVAPLMAKPSSTISGALPGKNMCAPGDSL